MPGATALKVTAANAPDPLAGGVGLVCAAEYQILPATEHSMSPGSATLHALRLITKSGLSSWSRG